MTDFDFANLTPEVAELPKREGGGRTASELVKNNPFRKFVSDTYNEEGSTGMAVTVPKSQLKTTQRLIRKAAEDLGIGVRIVTTPKSAEELNKLGDDKPVKVLFKGQKKKKFATRKRQGEKWETNTDGSKSVVSSEPVKPATQTPGAAPKPVAAKTAQAPQKPAQGSGRK
jgi:hypothetical protein